MKQRLQLICPECGVTENVLFDRDKPVDYTSTFIHEEWCALVERVSVMTLPELLWLQVGACLMLVVVGDAAGNQEQAPAA